MRRFGMPADLGQRFLPECVPENPASLLIEREQSPLLRLVVGDRLDVAVKTHYQVSLVLLDSRGHINPVIPQDRRGVSQTRNFSLPRNIFGPLDIPSDGSWFRGIQASSVWPSKLRPIAC